MSLPTALPRTAMQRRWTHYASPSTFYVLAGRMLPWCWAIAAVAAVAGLVVGLLVAPTDAQQGDAYRIIFVHVPAAWMSMVIYLAMAFWAAVGLVLNTRLASMMARALAPTGALMTLLALWTGALWGKPTWGTWWVWDARITSMLILLFLYCGVIALQSAIDNATTAARAAAILALVGVVNIPIIKYSVEWWHSLHQPATFRLTEKPAMPMEMWLPLLVMVVGYYLFFAAALLQRTRCELVERERKSRWVKELVENDEF